MVCNMNFSKHYGFFVAKGMKDMQGGIYFSANDMKKSVKISDLRRKDWDYVCFKFKLSRYIKKDKVQYKATKIEVYSDDSLHSPQKKREKNKDYVSVSIPMRSKSNQAREKLGSRQNQVGRGRIEQSDDVSENQKTNSRIARDKRRAENYKNRVRGKTRGSTNINQN